MKKKLTLLGGLAPQEFLRDYWQKKPLLIRQAIPDFNGLLSPAQLIELACHDEAQARLVTHKRGQWQLQQAPFEAEDFSALGKAKWTVLLQGLNHLLPSATELLKQFNFIPHARLDDLMVSYAPKGGGVGAHFDSYDVFLLQGKGHRRWQISAQSDRTLIDGAPLRILQNFVPEQEWILAPGDMLYLPPQYAHHGVAEDDCMTYSIGFRAPAYQELAEQFLVYLQDRICIDGMVSDPRLKLQAHPSEISSGLIKQVEQAIQQIQWDKQDIANFIGCYLSEPKPHIFFDVPDKLFPLPRFIASVEKNGITLNLSSQMLCHDSTVFLNGEAYSMADADYLALRKLADKRALPPHTILSQEAYLHLYAWYAEGALAIEYNVKNR